jgi:hypothetical protein
MTHFGASTMIVMNVIVEVRTLGNRQRIGTAGSASQARHILREIVIEAIWLTAAPITRTERGRATQAVASTATGGSVAIVMGTAHRRLAGRIAIGRRVAHVGVTTLRTAGHGRVGAPKTSSTSLEVGEAAGWASPVAGTRSVLRWREWRQHFRSTIKDAVRGGRDFDGLFAKSTTVHAEGFSSLEKSARDSFESVIEQLGRTSSCEEKMAKPVPVGLC